MIDITISELSEILEQAWDINTAHKSVRFDWKSNNKARGQCAVTSALVQRMYGGEIYKGYVKGEKSPHYWNILKNGYIVDLTKSQFNKETIIITQQKKVDIKQLFKDLDFKNRFCLLEQRVVILKAGLELP